MSIRDNMITAGLRAIGAYSRWKRPNGRITLGRTIGRALMQLDKRRLGITMANVDRSLPELAAERRADIVRGSYENLGITLAELLAVPSMSRADVDALVDMPGIEMLATRVAKRLPTVMVSGHYGNWELLAMSVGIKLDHPLTMVVHPQKNASADVVLNGYRSKFGNKLVPMREAARTLVRTLQDGGAIALLADQHANPQKDAWIDFFGRPTPTYEAPAALALRFGSPIYVAFAERMADGRYVAQLEEISIDDLSNTPEGVRRLTERHVQALERAIRRRPELWSWQHRRWRQDES
jgi:KDO2-lipid IV(A) lauroyltransferase